MKRLVLISVVLLLNGCDVSSYFYDTKIKYSSYICEANTSSKLNRKAGEEDLKKSGDETKGDKKIKPITFYFTLTQYTASNFSKNRNKGETYYEFRRIDSERLHESLTVNVWPKKEGEFTNVNSIKNGYDAYVMTDGKILRRNIEQVEVSDAVVKARMWDTYNDLDTFVKRAASPESSEKLKDKYKDTFFPIEDFENFKLNRISGKFYFEMTRYFGEEKKPDNRQTESLIYSGQCKVGLNL
jgi:hypothetical protein